MSPSDGQGDAMVSKPTPAWRMLSRMLDKLLAELSCDDLDDLHQRVQTERNRRFLESRRTPERISQEGQS